MRRRLALPLALALACAPTTDTPDASDGPDAGEIGSTDAGDLDAGLSEAPHALTLETTGGTSFAFEESGAGITFGVTDAENELYVESWHAGFTGCPANDSPTPDRTLIFSGISLDPEAPSLQTYAGGVRVSMLDFHGDVTAEPGPQRATAVEVTNLRVEGCPEGSGDCAGPFRFDVVATLPQGTLRGHVVAGRCASLDE